MIINLLSLSNTDSVNFVCDIESICMFFQLFFLKNAEKGSHILLRCSLKNAEIKAFFCLIFRIYSKPFNFEVPLSFMKQIWFQQTEKKGRYSGLTSIQMFKPIKL